MPASQARSGCPQGYVCLYSDANGGGFVVYISAGNSISNLGQACSNGVCYDFNDKLSSYNNNSGWGYCRYDDADYRGRSSGLGAHNMIFDETGSWNDSASSVKAIRKLPPGGWDC